MKVLDFDVRSQSRESNRIWLEAFDRFRKAQRYLKLYKSIKHISLLLKAEEKLTEAKQILASYGLVGSELERLIDGELESLYLLQQKEVKT